MANILLNGQYSSYFERCLYRKCASDRVYRLVCSSTPHDDPARFEGFLTLSQLMAASPILFQGGGWSADVVYGPQVSQTSLTLATSVINVRVETPIESGERYASQREFVDVGCTKRPLAVEVDKISRRCRTSHSRRYRRVLLHGWGPRGKEYVPRIPGATVTESGEVGGLVLPQPICPTTMSGGHYRRYPRPLRQFFRIRRSTSDRCGSCWRAREA